RQCMVLCIPAVCQECIKLMANRYFSCSETGMLTFVETPYLVFADFLMKRHLIYHNMQIKVTLTNKKPGFLKLVLLVGVTGVTCRWQTDLNMLHFKCPKAFVHTIQQKMKAL